MGEKKLTGDMSRVHFANDHDLEAMARTGAKTIVVNKDDYHTAALEAWDLIEEQNGYTDPSEFIFSFGELPHRLARNEDDRWTPELLTKDRVTYRLTDLAVWQSRLKNGTKRREQVCPRGVVSMVLATPDPPIPVLRRIVEAPVLDRHGKIIRQPGYHPDAKLFFMPSKRLKVPFVRFKPGLKEKDRALDLLLDELLVDFSFRDDADWAHAVCLFLEPFVRDMIDGPTPMYVVQAPTPGTGKGLLLDSALHAATGLASVPIMTPEGMDGQEWRKQITTRVMSGVPALKLDNVNELMSGVLSGALTDPIWRDRILGGNRELEIPIRFTWTATGNNVTMSREMVRRVVMIYLDPVMENPDERDGFTHELPLWAYEHRGELIWAALTLARFWAKGEPRLVPDDEEVPEIGSFTAWRRVMGGICRALELEGFLGNQILKREQARPSDMEGIALMFAKWFEVVGGRAVLLRELPVMVVEKLELRAAYGTSEFTKQLAQVMKRHLNSVIGGFRLCIVVNDDGVPTKRDNTIQYRMERIG